MQQVPETSRHTCPIHPIHRYGNRQDEMVGDLCHSTNDRPDRHQGETPRAAQFSCTFHPDLTNTAMQENGSTYKEEERL